MTVTTMPNDAIATSQPAPARPAPQRMPQPAKLLNSKWTAAVPINKEKHFIVVALVEPEPAGGVDGAVPGAVEVEIEAVLTRRRFTLRWRELSDNARWLQGWC